MIKKIKERFLEKRLQSVLKNQNREKSFLNFDEVKTIGIVFEATDPAQFEIIKNYVVALKQKGKRVHGIGFYDNKLIPENVYYSKTDFDLFSAKEINSMGEPVNPYIKTFISEVRDVLIDINFNQKYVLRHIAAHSYAKCKIGLNLPENAMVHDMLIAIDKDQGIEKYLEQIEKYLHMIVSKQEVKIKTWQKK
jgi:hypothetical protein